MTERPYHALKAIPDIDQKLLEGIAAGKSLKALGDEYGVSDVAVLNRVQDHPEYKRLRKYGIQHRMEARESELEAADTNVNVTRADRLLNHARWLAERLNPQDYGQKQEVNHSISIVKALESISVIEGEVIHSAAAQLPQSTQDITETGDTVEPDESAT